ncbi:MAG: AbrB/MazE/SpoVT family DNA-binding domain-containing protein [Thaumarchaeota archaeon]|nr:AbrB/MazE/SpoVT family DNA-binding domain-containing protein [Nitrososphaerota archaeon]
MVRRRDNHDRKINRANTDGSLKVTVPAAVVRELKLKPGDTVRFAVVEEDGKKVAKFTKLRVVVSED